MSEWNEASSGFQTEENCTCFIVPDECTCRMPPDDNLHLSFNDSNHDQMSFDRESHYETANEVNPFCVLANDEENKSQSHREKSSFYNERESFDASNERSLFSRPTRKRSKTRARGRSKSSGYDATFEDSLNPDVTFTQDFQSSLVDNQIRSRQRRVNRTQSISRGNHDENQCECVADLPAPQARNNPSMNDSERGRRNELHEMLDEESYTTNETLKEISNDPLNANILGYNYRVNSFR